jgi:pilus assembly protein CpaE
MVKDSLILLIQEDPESAELIRQAFAQYAEELFRLQCVERLSTALARVAGGGVDVIILDLALCKGSESERLDSFLRLRRDAPYSTILLLCGVEDEGLASKAIKAGAAHYFVKERCGGGIGHLILSAIEPARTKVELKNPVTPEQRRTGAIIALAGAKGGVGTTTVALNIASVLARQSSVAVVEMQPAFGALPEYFRTAGMSRNLSHLLKQEPDAIGHKEAEACLWPYKNIPGLKILFGPQAPEECQEIGPDHAKAIPRALAGVADYVIVDLRASLSDANRAAIEISDLLMLVVERDPVCVQLAKLMARAVETWNAAPQIGAVIVNRVAVSMPMPLTEIDAHLGCPTFGVIPPDPDLCRSAQNARTPLVSFDPASLMGEALATLAERLISAPQASALLSR